MIWNVLPGSGFLSIPDPDFFTSQIQGSKSSGSVTLHGPSPDTHKCVMIVLVSNYKKKMAIEKLNQTNYYWSESKFFYVPCCICICECGLNFMRIPDPSLSGPKTLRWLNQEVDYSIP